MGDKQEMIQTGIYVHTPTGDLYFVDGEVDWAGKGFHPEVGISHFRLFEQGRRCARPLLDFFEEMWTGGNNPDGSAEIKSRFVLVCQQPSQLLGCLLPGSVVYIPERHTVEKVIMVGGGVIYVCLTPYHEQGEVRMGFPQYFTKISHLRLVE